MPAREEPDDDTLLRAWRAGDRRAGSMLCGRYHGRIGRFFRTRRREDWEELTQSTFLACIEGIQRFRGEASFSTFVFAIARKKLLKRLREQSRDERRARSFDLGPDPADGSSWSRGSASAIHQRLLRTLRGLPADTQVMIELYYWEEQSIRAIAVRFGQPEGTIKARLHRGRQQILAELEGLEGCPSDAEIMCRALEEWAEALSRRGAADEPVKNAGHATAEVDRELPRCHEHPPPFLQTISRSLRAHRRARTRRM